MGIMISRLEKARKNQKMKNRNGKLLSLYGFLGLFILVLVAAYSVDNVYALTNTTINDNDPQGFDSATCANFDYWMKFFSIEGDKSKKIIIDETFSHDEEVYPFNQTEIIYGLTLSGSIQLYGDTSLIRVILVDNDFNEYLVYEAYPLIVTSNSFSVTNVCEETCLLDSIIPYSLKIEVVDASIHIDELSFSDSPIREIRDIAELQKQIKESQDAVKIKEINNQIKKKGLKWIAGETSVSRLFTAYAGKDIITHIGFPTQFRGYGTSPDDEVIKYEWDSDGDGYFDWHSTLSGEAFHTYDTTGTYYAKLRVSDSNNLTALDSVKVIVKSGSGPQEYVEPILPSREVPASLEADGIKDIYALIVSTTSWCSLSPMIKFYELLTQECDVMPDNIIYLVVGSEIPTGYEGIIDDFATKGNFINALEDLGNRADKDDLLIVNIECHGQGYLGYTPDNNRNIAYHGFCGVRPLIARPGTSDELDYRESEFELSVFCGSGLITGHDFHAGLGEWLVRWYYPPSLHIKRWKFLSHYDDVYVEGVGVLDDNDEDIDKFTDYTLGDHNKDGIINVEAGEVWDYDGDGVSPYDRYTGVFDEDDWGEIDEFENDYRRSHSSLGGIPFRIFDSNLDNQLDIDVYPSADGSLEVDGTDIDNDGCIEGIDINDDGDMDDWITLNEEICLLQNSITDDEVAEHFNNIECSAKIFIANTCYGGGFVYDLSGENTIIIAGSLEISGGSCGFLPGLLNEAFLTYPDEADSDGNGCISIMEAFNYAGEHPHVDCLKGMDLFQYDDNGDGISHMYPLPNAGDGGLGAVTYLEIIPPTVSFVVSCDGSGTEWNTFDLSENVYCYAGNLPAGTNVRIYVVANQDVWNDGDGLTDVSGGYETKMTGDDGSIPTTLIWGSLLTQGSYDIVVDTNRNGEWNEGEPIDDKLDVGFEVIDTEPPTIESVTLDTYTTILDASIHVTVEATDNVGVTSVTADGVALVETGSMSKGDMAALSNRPKKQKKINIEQEAGSIWEGDITAPSAPGDYTLTIRAEDAAGNFDEATVDYSVVTPQGGFGVAVLPLFSNVIAGDTVALTVKIISTENFDDHLHVYLSTEGLDNPADLGWFNWTDKNVMIPTRGEITIPLKAEIPTGVSGMKMFRVNVESLIWRTEGFGTGMFGIT